MSRKTKAKNKTSSQQCVIPERETIMDFLRKIGKPISRKQLAETFTLREDAERNALGYRLQAMKRDGQIIRNRRGNYGLIEKMDLITGRVIGHSDGYGFVVPEQGDSDLFLSAKQMRTVLNGDHVAVREIVADRKNKREAILVEVLERANERVVGRYYEESGIGYVVPDNKRISQNILIPPTEKKASKHGQYVVVKILQQPAVNRQMTGQVLTIIGEGLKGNMAIDIAIQSYELPFEWPDNVEDEIRHLEEEISRDDIENRKDIRTLPLVTIDGADARDFDDAVFCEKDGQGWRLLVAIADVSHYVKIDSALDNEARIRGTSVYFPDRVIPMLPEILSNGLCSLKPEVDRYCFVCELNIDAKGKVKNNRFFKAIMRSSARLTYDEMHAIVVTKNQNEIEKHQSLVAHLDDLYQLYQLLHQQRKRSGLLDFPSVETQFAFDQEGNVSNIHAVDSNDAHHLIEEIMLIANVAAGEFLEKHGINNLYRTHSIPKLEKLENVRALLSQVGLTLGGGKEPTAKDYAKLMQTIRKRDDASMLEMVLLRSMPLALYSAINTGHFGLGFQTYAHFTSPIRRYPDLLVHRAIEHVLNNNLVETFYYPEVAMLELAEHCSTTERRAEDASRDATQRLKCVYMQDKVDQVFTGTVSSVTAFGLFVILDNVYVEGLIHISNLPGDYYHHDQIAHSLRGERSGKIFKLGQKLKVLVSRVDIDDRKIDFELVDNG